VDSEVIAKTSPPGPATKPPDIKPNIIYEPIATTPVPNAVGTQPFDSEPAAQARAALSAEVCAALAAEYAEALTLKGNMAKKEEAAAALAACKEQAASGGFGPMSATADTCASGQGVVCAYDYVRHVPFLYFPVTNLSPVEVKTENLTQLPGGSTPDTVLYVVRLDAGSTTTGTIVQIDDDGNTETTPLRDSLITFTPQSTGLYLAIVRSYAHGREGYADIIITANGGSATAVEHQVFGGFQISPKEVRARDVLAVGENTNTADMPDAPDYHDSTLFLFGSTAHDCDSNCGAFQFSDDAAPGGGADASLFSRIDVAANMTAARVVVGTYHGEYATNLPYQWNGRLLHLRRHTSQEGGGWTGDEQKDNDGDGLSREIETAIGSCDLVSDAPTGGVVVKGAGCQTYATLVNTWLNANKQTSCSVPATGADSDARCWHGADSDNDGIPDGAEVLAAVVACNQSPVPPRYDTGTCAPLTIRAPAECPTGKYCSTLELSALGDPDPTTYDVFFLEQHFACTGSYCAADHGSGSLNHAVRAGQQSRLIDMWTTDPSTCWDGSTPVPPASCPGLSDRLYRTAMHVFSGGDIAVKDDSVRSEVDLGLDGTNSYFNASFGRPGHCPPGFSCAGTKYTNVFRHGVLGHNAGGTTTIGNRHVVAGNASNAPDSIILRDFSHEAGHTLGLVHGQNKPAGGTSGCSATNCPDQSCQCAPCQGDCANKAADVSTANPLVASVMNYDYQNQGLRQKSTAPPAAQQGCFSGCSQDNFRFSKGLNGSLNETELDERWTQDWNSIKRAQDLACFDDRNDCPYCSALGWQGVGCGSGSCCDAGESCTPFCDGAFCWFNWDNARSGQAPQPPYAFDLTHGVFSQTSSCAADQLSDRDEWLGIVAGAKSSLSKTAETYFSIYRDTFNGAGNTPSNMDAWTFPITNSGVEFNTTTYERNVCHVDIPGECAAGMACLDDTCGMKACLKGQACGMGNVCTCGNDSDCRSGWCEENLCKTTRGGCGCADDNACTCSAQERDSDQCCEPGVNSCHPLRAATAQPSTPGDRSPRESAAFDGPTSSDYLRLDNSQNSDPALGTIGADNSFEVRFDFRWDGGPSTQVLWKSAAFQLTLYSEDNSAWLGGVVAGEGLVFPNGSSGAYLEPHRWYRVTWNASVGRGTHLLQVVAWNMRTASYDTSAGQGSGCVWATYNMDMPAVGDVWIGYDGSANATRFKGRMDAVRLTNYTMPVGDAAVTCVQ